jgi:hypothetical protein
MPHVAAGCSQLQLFDICGGAAEPKCLSADGSKRYCRDTAWEDRCCPTGTSCIRVNSYLWQCKPGETA